MLLAVNISFLAIPAVAPMTLHNGQVTVGQVASLCSTLFSVGCMLIGLLLVNQHLTTSKDVYLVRSLLMSIISCKLNISKWLSGQVDPYSLSILFSLPHALLMWRCVKAFSESPES